MKGDFANGSFAPILTCLSHVRWKCIWGTPRAARELTIGGRFKGTIQADRVTLTNSAVVEGEIHHRSLAIEENAWFAGASRPKEVSASEDADPQSLIQLVPTDANRQRNSSLEKEVHGD